MSNVFCCFKVFHSYKQKPKPVLDSLAPEQRNLYYLCGWKKLGYHTLKLKFYLINDYTSKKPVKHFVMI